jgi:hypothetical protein
VTTAPPVTASAAASNNGNARIGRAPFAGNVWYRP